MRFCRIYESTVFSTLQLKNQRLAIVYHQFQRNCISSARNIFLRRWRDLNSVCALVHLNYLSSTLAQTYHFFFAKMGELASCSLLQTKEAVVSTASFVWHRWRDYRKALPFFTPLENIVASGAYAPRASDAPYFLPCRAPSSSHRERSRSKPAPFCFAKRRSRV